MLNKKFPFYRQSERMDCGVACIQMILKYYGKELSLSTIKERCFLEKQGMSLLDLSNVAESFYFKTLGVNINFQRFVNDISLPCIIHWKNDHFVVVYKITSKYIYIADPALGFIKYNFVDFQTNWGKFSSSGGSEGIVLILEPTNDFGKNEDEDSSGNKIWHLISYLSPFKGHFLKLFIGLIVGNMLQLCFPLIMQYLVDKGINTGDVTLIQLLLLSQFAIFAGKTFLDFLRKRIILYVGTKINIAFISDFLITIMKLPSLFFKNRRIGDILQRIKDHKKIELFLTSYTLHGLYNFLSIILFGGILFFYNATVFLIFILSSVIYVLWVVLLLKRRRVIDIKRFENASSNNSNLIQIISGIDDIKLNNCEKEYRLSWEKLQDKLFEINKNGLLIDEVQKTGALVVSQLRNLFITYIIALSVVNGEMTLGMMLAVMTIFGYLNSPLDYLINFSRALQDAQIGFERLDEINTLEDEENGRYLADNNKNIHDDIIFQSTSFSYNNLGNNSIIDAVTFTIPQNSVTAIVGSSGSGKTTLVKLMLGLLVPTQGKIFIGKDDLLNINLKNWRNNCGAVMQDGFIFANTIAHNIALSDVDNINSERLIYASEMAMVGEFVRELPLMYETELGPSSRNLSQGQKQRILLARAIYKNPKYFFLDEATNSLDSKNERIINDNLKKYFCNRTAIVIAHRLSTIKYADNILVLNNGKIVEQGNFTRLVDIKGYFYQLFKNQI